MPKNLLTIMPFNENNVLIGVKLRIGAGVIIAITSILFIPFLLAAAVFLLPVVIPSGFN